MLRLLTSPRLLSASKQSFLLIAILMTSLYYGRIFSFPYFFFFTRSRLFYGECFLGMVTSDPSHPDCGSCVNGVVAAGAVILVCVLCCPSPSLCPGWGSGTPWVVLRSVSAVPCQSLPPRTLPWDLPPPSPTAQPPQSHPCSTAAFLAKQPPTLSACLKSSKLVAAPL